MNNREGNSHEGKTNLYARRGTEGGGDMVISQYANRRTWGKIEDNQTDYEKLLVAGSYEGSGKVYG